MKRTLFPLLALTATLSAQQPLIQATSARLWLKVPADQPPLRDIRVSTGSATPAPWEKDPAIRERHSDILFPIRWWAWNELEVSFTPERDGRVELSLNGPWGKEMDGVMPRGEVLWDDITAENAEIRNGGFEESTEKGPAAWESPWSPYVTAESWPLTVAEPLSGKSVAASWCQRPLSQTFQVKAGLQVVLKLHAKAATTPDFIAPKQLPENTPAHRALALLKRGVNLGNGWEAPPDQNWGVHFTPEDIDQIADEGFDHIRVPVAWHFYLREKNGPYEIDPEMLAKIEPVLRRALERKLQVMLNWHHFNDFTAAPATNRDRFIGGWETIARHFRSWPPGLFLELLNEPCDALSTEALAPIYQKTAAAIRAIDPLRILVMSPGQWGQVGELDKLRLPDSDDRIIVTVHCYEPFQFTHQGAGWVGFQQLRGIVYPGPPAKPFVIPDLLKDNTGVRAFVDDYNTLPAELNPCSSFHLRQTFDAAQAWSRHFGRPVHLGEFGSHNVGDPASRGRYLHDVKSLAEERGIPWTLWEWKSSFGYWDPVKNQPVFRKALME
jgi:endoglucanase